MAVRTRRVAQDELTGPQESAAALLADGALHDGEIATQCGVDIRTIANWKRRPAFAARVEELRGEIRARVKAEGIASLENRMRRLGETWTALQQVIAERAASPLNATSSTPGLSTGLLTITAVSKTGRPIYGVDVALLKELRETEKQAAIEMGQWQEKREYTGTVPVVITSIAAVQPATRLVEEQES